MYQHVLKDGSFKPQNPETRRYFRLDGVGLRDARPVAQPGEPTRCRAGVASRDPNCPHSPHTHASSRVLRHPAEPKTRRGPPRAPLSVDGQGEEPMGGEMGGSERMVSRKRAPPETPRAQRASGPGEKGERSCDFPGEAGDQGRVPQALEGNLARLHSGCGGVRRREPPRSSARHPPPTRPPVHARPGPLGDGGASLLPTSELNSFSLPTEMFHSGTLPREPLNSRQPPRLGDHLPDTSFWARLAEIANSRPVGAEASLLFYFHWSAFMSIKYTFWPCCRSGPPGLARYFPESFARVLESPRETQAGKARLHA